MDQEVLRILIIAVAVVLVVIVALLLGRRLRISRGDTSLETDRGRPTMRMSATRGGIIEDGGQVAEGDSSADMDMTARRGTLRRVEQRTGRRSGGS